MFFPKYGRYTSLRTLPSTKVLFGLILGRMYPGLIAGLWYFIFKPKLIFLEELLNFYHFETLNDLGSEQWFNKDFQICRLLLSTL